MEKIIYFSVFIFLCSSCNLRNHDAMKQAVIYACMDENKFKHYIVLVNMQEKPQGFVMGSELNLDAQSIYYKAEMDHVKKHNANNFSFILTTFVLSTDIKAMDSYFQTEILPPADKEIPLMLKNTLYYNCEMLNGKIKVSRTSDLYDSRADEMVFTKVVR